MVFKLWVLPWTLMCYCLIYCLNKLWCSRILGYIMMLTNFIREKNVILYFNWWDRARPTCPYIFVWRWTKVNLNTYRAWLLPGGWAAHKEQGWGQCCFSPAGRELNWQRATPLQAFQRKRASPQLRMASSTIGSLSPCRPPRGGHGLPSAQLRIGWSRRPGDTHVAFTDTLVEPLNATDVPHYTEVKGHACCELTCLSTARRACRILP